MGQKKRQRTAQHHLSDLDWQALGLAENDIYDHNFKKLLDQGVLVKEKEICDKCHTRPVMHESWDIQTGVKTSLCCQCHISEGGIPADWHSECIRLYQKGKQDG